MNINASKIAKLLDVTFILLLFTIGNLQASAQLNLTVTRGDDRNNATCVAGDCSLREAVKAANASPADDTINFAPGLTAIMLTNDLIVENAGALTINGPGSNNLTIHGGGGNRIFTIHYATVTISGVTLTDGGSGGAGFWEGPGGAIYTVGGSLTLDGVNVSGNRSSSDPYAGYDGGGAYFDAGGINRVLNSTFSGNFGYDCGGFGSNGTLTVVNSTISGNNTAANDMTLGGGFCSEGNTTLRNVTVTDNGSDIGGGISHFGPGTLNIGNSIVAGNRHHTSCYCFAAEMYSDPSAITSGGNLIGDSPGDSSDTGVQIAYQSSDILDTDPLLGPRQNNGGATPTHALLPGSPAIDKGLNNLVSQLATDFDQRGTGFPRIRDGNGDNIATVDIGAFESNVNSVANIAGRVFTSDGRGLRNAVVWITDSHNFQRSVTTSSFGSFTFNDVPTGVTYTMGVKSKLYRFNSQSFEINGDLTGVIFVGLE